MSRRLARGLVLLLALPLAGCPEPLGLEFDPLSAPAPLTQAAICDGDEACGGVPEIVLTQGMALAFECSYNGFSCTHVEGTVTDARFATFLTAYDDTVSPERDYAGFGIDGNQPEGVLVVLAGQPGDTELMITTDQGTQSFQVHVVELQQ